MWWIYAQCWVLSSLSSCETSPTPSHWRLFKCWAAYTSWLMWCHGLTFRGSPFPLNVRTVARMAGVLFFSFTALFLLNAPTHKKKTHWQSHKVNNRGFLVFIFFICSLQESNEPNMLGSISRFVLFNQVFSTVTTEKAGSTSKILILLVISQ